MIILIETESLHKLFEHIRCLNNACDDNPSLDSTRLKVQRLLVDAYHNPQTINDEDDLTLYHLEDFIKEMLQIYKIHRPDIVRVNEDISITLKVGVVHAIKYQ
jgi:hypothetical protein